MANISLDTALQLVGRDQMKLKGVVSPDKALPFMIAAKKSIATPQDLNGKVFGVARVGSRLEPFVGRGANRLPPLCATSQRLAAQESTNAACIWIAGSRRASRPRSAEVGPDACGAATRRSSVGT